MGRGAGGTPGHPVSSGFEWHQMLLREGGSQGAGTAPELRPTPLGLRPLAGLSHGTTAMPTWLLALSGGFHPGGPPSRAQASSLPTEAPACPSPASQPCSPNPGRPQPHGHQPPALPASVTPKLASPSPPHSSPLPGTLGSSGTPPTAPETAQSSQRPAAPPTRLSHGNPSKALPSPLCCAPDRLPPPPQPWVLPWPTGNVPA